MPDDANTILNEALPRWTQWRCYYPTACRRGYTATRVPRTSGVKHSTWRGAA